MGKRFKLFALGTWLCMVFWVLYCRREVVKVDGSKDHLVGRRNDVCKPTEHVLFLKTHKTGSSTITNIINRYAEKRNKTILLPYPRHIFTFQWPEKFERQFSEQTHGCANFLANHARYNSKVMQYLFPRAPYFYVTILRHPVPQWESTFQFMNFADGFNMKDKPDPIDYFLNHPPPNEAIEEIAQIAHAYRLVKNPQFFDLGLDYEHFEDLQYIQRAIEKINKEFDLVLITEYFDESLTLLRRRLCWDIDDVLYFKLNERLSQNRRKLSQVQVEKVKVWNQADIALYELFLKKFWKEVEKEGPSFSRDVKELKERRETLSKQCIMSETTERAYAGIFVKGFKIRENLSESMQVICDRMLKNELSYMKYFRSREMSLIASLDDDNVG